MNRHMSRHSKFRSAPGYARLVLPLRLALMGAAAGAITGLSASALMAALRPGPDLPLIALGHSLLVTGVTSLLGSAMGAAIGHLTLRRLSYLLALTDAWLHGNLSVRADALHHDEIGQIERRLNLIIEHLEENEQALDGLQESNTRLTDQVRALAVVEERNRLARELHDSVKQHLFSLAMTASAIRSHLSTMERQNKPVSPELDDMILAIETSAQIAQRETTRLIEDLRPAPLQERGLVAALNDYTLLFGAQQHLLVHLDVRCNDSRLPPLIAETLYRVVQEALHNVARHAHAARVDVALHHALGRLTLTIKDDGVGFDPNRTHKGLGISSMQERLINVGGRLQVESEPGSGTLIRAEVETPEADTVLGTTQPQTAVAHASRVRTEAWGWLGQKLMIPVGQMWPWPPAEQERHLRAPLVDPGEYVLKQDHRFWGLLQRYTLWSRAYHAALMHLHPDHNGMRWEAESARWALRRITGRQGRAILERNDQPLAALQHRGHQLDRWTDIIYDDHFYFLTAKESTKEPTGGSGVDRSRFVLSDESDKTLVEVEGTLLHLTQALPLPLLLMVAARVIEEGSLHQTTATQDAVDQGLRRQDRNTPDDQALRRSLSHDLRTIVQDAPHTLPSDLLDEVRSLAQSLHTALEQVDNIGGSSRDAYTVRQTVRDYLPTALAGYGSLPRSFAATEPIQDGKTADEHLRHQLRLLRQTVDEIAERLPREGAQHLLSHGRFLTGKFGKEADSPVTDRDIKS